MWALEPTLNETKMHKRCDNATPTPPITQKGMRAYARRPGDSALGLARGECAPKRLACHRFDCSSGMRRKQSKLTAYGFLPAKK